MTFARVVATELSKLRRSTVTWITLAAYTLIVGMSGVFMWLMMNPDLAKSIGLIGQKAQLAFGGESLDWPTFLTFLVEMGGIGGLVMCSIIVTYVFGREYAEGTAKNMLALPIPRRAFVFAKLVVSAAWFFALTLWVALEGLIVGSILGLSGLTTTLYLSALGKLLVLALLSLCCSVLVAWVAVETRGYFAALGFAIATLVIASIFGRTGWAPWVPWCVVGIYSGAAGADIALGWGSFAVVAATLVIGTGLVLRHEAWADNGQ